MHLARTPRYFTNSVHHRVKKSIARATDIVKYVLASEYSSYSLMSLSIERSLHVDVADNVRDGSCWSVDLSVATAKPSITVSAG